MSYFSLFQSPHPARGATRGEEAAADITDNFNPRTPRGVRPDISIFTRRLYKFQSTHPARGATVILLSIPSVSMYFNPRTPRGVRHIAARNFANAIMISIHAPREGCDLVSDGAEVLRAIFQSTHPARGATGRGSSRRYFPGISIHAPREGCDISLPVISLMLS